MPLKLLPCYSAPINGSPLKICLPLSSPLKSPPKTASASWPQNMSSCSYNNRMSSLSWRCISQTPLHLGGATGMEARGCALKEAQCVFPWLAPSPGQPGRVEVGCWWWHSSNIERPPGPGEMELPCQPWAASLDDKKKKITDFDF